MTHKTAQDYAEYIVSNSSIVSIEPYRHYPELDKCAMVGYGSINYPWVVAVLGGNNPAECKAIADNFLIRESAHPGEYLFCIIP